jgi:peptide/nickel transport system permease protein
MNLRRETLGAMVGGRLVQAALVTLLSSTTIFLLIRRVPGDPAEVIAGPTATPATLAALRHSLALDRPLPIQYLHWLGRLIEGNLGTSILTHQPVTQMILTAFVPTLQLSLAAAIPAVLFGIAFGVLGALFRNSLLDAVLTGFSSLSLGIPSFWLGTVLLYFFVLKVHLFPPGGWTNVFHHPVAGLRSLVLPAFVLAVIPSAVISRFVRAGMIDALQQDHVRTARSKGLPEWLIVWRYGLRNALIPVVTVLGLVLGNLLAGVIVIEIVFSWPGLGMLLVNSVNERDYPVIEGGLLWLIAIFLLVNLVVDVLYIHIDPRTRR